LQQLSFVIRKTAFLGLSVLLLACDTGGVGDGGPGNNNGTPGGAVFGLSGWATIRSLVGDITYHSGYDGQNSYQVPLAFVGQGEPVFTVSDPNVATVITTLPINDPRIPEGVSVRAVLVATTGAGTTTITGTLDGQPFPATLVVNQYQPADVTLGTNRYLNSPTPPNPARVACDSCHATLAKHSTAFMADLTDDEILRTEVEGVGVMLRNPTTGEIQSYMPNDGNHTWDVTAQERVGIAAYLRSRNPLYQLPNF